MQSNVWFDVKGHRYEFYYMYDVYPLLRTLWAHFSNNASYSTMQLCLVQNQFQAFWPRKDWWQCRKLAPAQHHKNGWSHSWKHCEELLQEICHLFGEILRFSKAMIFDQAVFCGGDKIIFFLWFLLWASDLPNVSAVSIFIYYSWAQNLIRGLFHYYQILPWCLMKQFSDILEFQNTMLPPSLLRQNILLDVFAQLDDCTVNTRCSEGCQKKTQAWGREEPWPQASALRMPSAACYHKDTFISLVSQWVLGNWGM